jgi:hypothetical protein
MLGTCFAPKKNAKKVNYFNMLIAINGSTSIAMANWSERFCRGVAGRGSWL